MSNTLIYYNSKENLKKKNLGGIETLNLNLFKKLKKSKINCEISNKITKRISKKKWKNIISSNDARIFSKISSENNYLWLHNKLQIEKAFRKRQIFSIFKNKISAIYNSKYLYNNTSKLYYFKKKIIIPNFLSKEFEDVSVNYNRKPFFVWSVQRNKGLDKVIDIWINEIYSKDKKFKLFIFGISKSNLERYNLKRLSNYNVYYKGRVNKQTLIGFYRKSLAMICLGYDETFCLNAIESFACGLPIITFGHTAVAEISNQQNSFKLTNYNDIAKRIIQIANMNLRSRKKLINNCIKFSRNYCLDLIINKWLKLINK